MTITRIRMNRSEFLGAVSLALSIVPAKPTVPHTGCVRIKMSTLGKLEISATNLIESITIRHVKYDGSWSGPALVVPGKELDAVLRSLSSEDSITLDVGVQPSQIVISAGSADRRGSKYTLPMMDDPENFPQMPNGDRAGLRPLALDPIGAARAIRRVAGCASSDQTRPTVSAVLLEHHADADGAGTLLAVATDGHRLAVASTEDLSKIRSDGAGAWRTLLPALAVPAISQILKQADVDHTVEITDDRASATVHIETKSAERQIVYSCKQTLSADEFPPYRQVIPDFDSMCCRIGLDASVFCQALRRLSAVIGRDVTARMTLSAKDGSKPIGGVRVDSLQIEAIGDHAIGGSQGVELVDVESTLLSGSERRIDVAANLKYLIDGVSMTALDGDVAPLSMALRGGADPIVMTSPSAMVVIMPRRY